VRTRGTAVITAIITSPASLVGRKNLPSPNDGHVIFTRHPDRHYRTTNIRVASARKTRALSADALFGYRADSCPFFGSSTRHDGAECRTDATSLPVAIPGP